MKVITLKQPWATLISEGLNEYEFRSWKTSYRGKLYIHAGKGIDKKDLDSFKELIDVYDKVGMPISFKEIKKNYESIFLIIEEDNAWIYRMLSK